MTDPATPREGVRLRHGQRPLSGAPASGGRGAAARTERAATRARGGHRDRSSLPAVQVGRAPFRDWSRGVAVSNGDAGRYRCRCGEDLVLGDVVDHIAGHVATEEGKEVAR